MGLIADILGALRAPGAKPRRSIADVEEALALAARERAAARTALADAMRERDELLLEDDSDAKIAAADAAADAARLKLERLDAAEPVLVAELQALRSDARQARWRDLAGRHATASRDLAAALRAAVERRAHVLNLHDEARRLGFEAEAVAAFSPPALLATPEALYDYESALDRLADAEAASASPPPPMPAPAPKPVAAAPKAPAQARAARPAPPPARAKVQETPAEGEVAVDVIRAGFEVRGKQYGVGDRVALPADLAHKAMLSGAVDRPSTASAGGAA